MGIKDVILNKMLSKMMKGINIDEIQKNAKKGKYDINNITNMMQNLLGKEASDKMVKEIQAKVDKGEKVGMSMIMDLIKRMDISKIKDRAEKGKINEEELQSALNGLVGKKQAEQIFTNAANVVKEEDVDD